MFCFLNILVAADFSEHSRQAFSIACALAREDKTRVFVVGPQSCHHPLSLEVPRAPSQPA
jgi:hypothetical protein